MPKGFLIHRKTSFASEPLSLFARQFRPDSPNGESNRRGVRVDAYGSRISDDNVEHLDEVLVDHHRIIDVVGDEGCRRREVDESVGGLDRLVDEGVEVDGRSDGANSDAGTHSESGSTNGTTSDMSSAEDFRSSFNINNSHLEPVKDTHLDNNNSILNNNNNSINNKNNNNIINNNHTTTNLSYAAENGLSAFRLISKGQRHPPFESHQVTSPLNHSIPFDFKQQKQQQQQQ